MFNLCLHTVPTLHKDRSTRSHSHWPRSPESACSPHPWRGPRWRLALTAQLAAWGTASPAPVPPGHWAAGVRGHHQEWAGPHCRQASPPLLRGWASARNNPSILGASDGLGWVGCSDQAGGRQAGHWSHGKSGREVIKTEAHAWHLPPCSLWCQGPGEVVGPGEELEEGVWWGASAQSERKLRGSPGGLQEEAPTVTFGRGASACPQSSPQSPNTSHLWLVMRHSFQGCLTFYSLAPPTGLFQDRSEHLHFNTKTTLSIFISCTGNERAGNDY